MNRISTRFIPALLTFLVVASIIRAGEPDSIISEWNTSIQMIRTDTFGNWPGVEGRVPMDVSAAGGRIWLVWPGALVSLNMEGSTDARTLLTLFSSGRSGGIWTPENGLMCSDGIWRTADPRSAEITELNPFTSEVNQRPWEGSGPVTLYPAYNGDLLVLSPVGAEIVEPYFPPAEDRTDESDRGMLLHEEPPVFTLAAASGSAPLLAWREAGAAVVNVADYRGGAPAREVPVPPDVWGMDWAGNYLVFAGPGRLTVLNFSPTGSPVTAVLEDSRLPGRWYRIRGGSEGLLVHSPETGVVAMVRRTRSDVSPAVSVDDFAAILESRVLEAGSMLEDSDLSKEAEAFYGWALPHVRTQRSRHPLSESWPQLEQTITRRRTALRDRLN